MKTLFKNTYTSVVMLQHGEMAILWHGKVRGQTSFSDPNKPFFDGYRMIKREAQEAIRDYQVLGDRMNYSGKKELAQYAYSLSEDIAESLRALSVFLQDAFFSFYGSEGKQYIREVPSHRIAHAVLNY